MLIFINNKLIFFICSSVWLQTTCLRGFLAVADICLIVTSASTKSSRKAKRLFDCIMNETGRWADVKVFLHSSDEHIHHCLTIWLCHILFNEQLDTLFFGSWILRCTQADGFPNHFFFLFFWGICILSCPDCRLQNRKENR